MSQNNNIKTQALQQFEQDSEFKSAQQAKKEALATLFLYALYFLWSTLTAYGISLDPIDSLIFGFPAWFFFSCILGYPLCCIGVYILIQKVFKSQDKKTFSQKGVGE